MALFEKPWGNYALEHFSQTPMPSEISWWPETLAWKFIALFMVLWLGIKTHSAIKTYINNAYRREAVACMKALKLQLLSGQKNTFAPQHITHTTHKLIHQNHIETSSNTPHDESHALLAQARKLPTLLRKVAIQSFSRKEISALGAKEWECWLDKQCPQANFQHHCSGLLNTLSYADPEFFLDEDKQLTAHSITAIVQLIEVSSFWICNHRGQHD